MKRKIINIVLIIIMIITLYLGFNSQNIEGQANVHGEILVLFGGTILGHMYSKFLEYVDDIDLYLLVQTIFNWNKKIRVSFSYLFRIQIDGTYFLIRGNKKKRFQPVGGVYQKYKSSDSILRNIFEEDDELKKGNENDLRGKVLGKDLKKFIKWFESRQDREITCYREFNEEMIKKGIIDKKIFGDIHYCYLGVNKTNIFTSEYYGKEFLLAEIFELQLDEEKIKVFRSLKERYDKTKDNSKLDYAFVSEDEIRRQHTKKRKYDDFEKDINNHTYKILKGEYK